MNNSSEKSSNRTWLWIQIVLLLGAAMFFSIDVNRPLVDYDEATYAKVITDTLDAGNVMTFKMGERSWFEKPPLYLWLSMVSVKIFGEHEFSFRIPSIIAAILSCWLVLLIAYKLTGNKFTASLAFLVLLFSPLFFEFQREARLDSAVTLSILVSLFFFIKSWENEKHLFWVFPFIAIGFLFKSVIALLAVPVILAYSFFYSKWSYIKSKYLWWGFGFAVVILAPWHIYESAKFGSVFWGDYLGKQVFRRAVTTLTGTSGYFDYVNLLWYRYIPWSVALVLLIALVWIIGRAKKLNLKAPMRNMLVPLGIGLFIFALFTFAKTHLAPYVLPAFPFFALSVAISFQYFLSLIQELELRYVVFFLLFLCILGSAMFCYYLRVDKVPPYTFEQRDVGKMYKDHNTKDAPLYVLDFPPTETFNYYGDAEAHYLDPRTVGGTALTAPSYLIARISGASYFFYDPQNPVYPGTKLLYLGNYFALIYFDRDIEFPVLQMAPVPEI